MLDRLEMNAAQLERLQERLAMQQTPATEYHASMPASSPSRAIPPVGEPSTTYVPGRGGVDMIHMGDGYFTEAVKASVAKRGDVTGSVIDADGEPITDADVLLVLKSWPNNRFRQDDFAVKTDASGGFTLKGRVPLDGQYGINAVVVAEGHAIASHYVLVEDPQGEAPEPIEFALVPSVKTRLVLTDSDGKPVARAVVAPSGRTTADDAEHLVYHQGSQPVWRKTDENGAVEIDWFAVGDLGKVNIRPRRGEWGEHPLDITESGSDLKIGLD